MSVTVKYRGNEIVHKNYRWVYKDTGLSVEETHQERPCGKCNKERTSEGYDACLGTLPGTMNACCGHGETGDAYVQLLDGESIQGKDAITILKILSSHRG